MLTMEGSVSDLKVIFFLLFNKNRLLNNLTKSTELGSFSEFGRSADRKQNVLEIRPKSGHEHTQPTDSHTQCS